MNTKRLNEIIRVNHAGEHGAVAIYKGQINALKLMGCLLYTSPSPRD